jgi:hypothetical protein
MSYDVVEGGVSPAEICRVLPDRSKHCATPCQRTEAALVTDEHFLSSETVSPVGVLYCLVLARKDIH